jgi:L-fuconolactonase
VVSTNVDRQLEERHALGSLEIVDAQLHELGPELSWPSADAALRYRLMTEITLGWMDAVGVDAAVLVPMDWGWGEAVLAEGNERLACVYALRDPGDPALEETVAELRTRPGIVGVRASFGRLHADPTGEAGVARVREGVYESAFRAAAKHELPFFCSSYGHAYLVGEIADRHPDLSLIVDHMGIAQPPLNQRETPPWRSLSDVLALADRPNIAVKLCGAPVLSDQRFPFADVWPHIHRLLEAFGLERVMWASDIGRFAGRLGWENRYAEAQGAYAGKHSYAESLLAFRETHELSAEEKARLLGGTTRSLLGWR